MPNYFETANIPVLAAEFHYFRLAREKWEFMLSRLGQMGANTLMLSIPWGFHEVERGVVDLTGTTNNRRDVVGLLKLCTALKFTCILEPGPYNRAGVLGNGLPLWLLERTADLETALPEAVATWYKALSQALTDQQWPAGPVIALNIESEPAEVESLSISKQLTEVKWPIWLRKRYEGIQALNAAYGTSYRTISEVKFPENWAAATTPLEKDAQAFLETTRRDTQIDYRQILLDSGWQLPIYSPNSDTPSPWQNFSLTNSDGLAAHTAPLNLQQPIQIEPDPIDIGRSPVWAEGAPIRSDGSLREKFWQVRSTLWPQVWPEMRLIEQTLVISFPGGSAVTRSSEAVLKIDLPIRAKPALYRLRLTGELVNEDILKVSRGKLSGLYRAEDDLDQTDLVLVFDNPLAPLSNFPLTCLSQLLAAQAHTLARCAVLASALAQTLAPPPVEAKDSASERPTRASYIETAQRGLTEADAALRKALTSISELEGGMATILGKGVPQPAHAPVAINRAIFEGRARDVLAEIGAACAKIGPTLQSTAASLQHRLEAPTEFTLGQYRQSYTAAITAARAGRQPLLEAIALLRLEIASERLPLVAWRIHNQVQEIAESLRWGVLRG
jgi:hypothetical protein